MGLCFGTVFFFYSFFCVVLEELGVRGWIPGVTETDERKCEEKKENDGYDVI